MTNKKVAAARYSRFAYPSGSRSFSATREFTPMELGCNKRAMEEDRFGDGSAFGAGRPGDCSGTAQAVRLNREIRWTGGLAPFN